MLVMNRIKTILDLTASISMIATACFVLFVIISGSGKAANGNKVESYRVGDTFRAPAKVDFRSAGSTLVVYIRSGCRYCSESMEFYRQVAATKRTSRFVVMGMEDEPTLRRYLDENALRPDQVVSVEPGSQPMRATPSLVLVSSDAKVKQVWTGKLRSAADEAAVLDSIR